MLRTIYALAASVAMIAVAGPAYAFSSDRIIVTTKGSGKDVILVPGLTSNPRIYGRLTAALPGYRYHLVQVRGFSGTKPEGNASGDVPAAVAEELARYVRDQKLEKPALIGHSMGGTIGMILASRHPDSLGKLMVVDMLPFTGAFFGAKNGTEARAILGRMQQQWSADPQASRAQQTQMVSAMVNSDAERPAVLEDSRTSDPALVGRTFLDIQATDLRDELKSAKAPLTVLYVKPGQAGAMSDEQFDGLYRKQYANARGVTLTRIPDAAHFIMLDAPDRFAAEVNAFLERR
jgi:pimeloyl-ACP methyl ester carboxylesterase